VLERFIHDMQDGRTSGNPSRAVLTASAEAVGAEIALVYSNGQVLDISGGDEAPPAWAREAARHLIEHMPGGGLWNRSTGSLNHHPAGPPRPTSALILPIESATPAWVIALGFNPDTPLVASGIRVMKVIWQLQSCQNRHVHVFDNLKETLFGVVRCLSTAIDAKDPYTCGHSERVARIAVRIGQGMSLARGEISDLYLAGLLHDVGKIGIRDDVLCKPGPLNDEEFAHIREHPVTGDRIIANVTRLAYLRPGVRGHHERYDGKGYPDGLAGDAIPLMARIIAVADSCDAMMSARRYRPALMQNKIEQIFSEGQGTQWDPQVVEQFFACRHELYAVCQRGLGQSVYDAVQRAADDNPLARRARPQARRSAMMAAPAQETAAVAV
jgi:HD-GYP domain-containing protein (c-di-GMP phosphodiesterase class II)